MRRFSTTRFFRGRSNIKAVSVDRFESSRIAQTASADWFEGKSTLPKWAIAQQLAEERASGLFSTPQQELVNSDAQLSAIMRTLVAESGIDIVAIDMADKSDVAEFMVVVEGRNSKHVYALADAVRMLFKHTYSPDAFMPHTLSIDGADSDWMTVDTGKIIVHSFMPEARKEYDLEGLWEGFKDQNIIDARKGYPDPEASARRINEEVHSGMENQFSISLKRLESNDLISEEEIRNTMR